MRYVEFSDGLQHFKAIVRVANAAESMTVATTITAQSLTQALFMLRYLYGKDAVLSLLRL
jgi:hypothetical protein